jgi:hypothetical protein
VREPYKCRPALVVMGTYQSTAPHIWTLEAPGRLRPITSILFWPTFGNQPGALEPDLQDRPLDTQPTATSKDQSASHKALAVDPQRTPRCHSALVS